MNSVHNLQAIMSPCLSGLQCSSTATIPAVWASSSIAAFPTNFARPSVRARIITPSTTDLLPGPPPGFGPPGFPELPQLRHCRHVPPPVSPTVLSHQAMYSNLGAPLDPSLPNIPHTLSDTAFNSPTQPSLLTDILLVYAGHHIIDPTTNPYSQLFFGKREAQNNNNNNNYYCNGNGLNKHDVSSKCSTASSYEAIAQAFPNARTGVPIQKMCAPIAGNPQLQPCHYKVFQSNNINHNNYRHGNSAVGTRSQLQQQLKSDTAFFNQNHLQSQWHRHDLLLPSHLPKVRPQYQDYMPNDQEFPVHHPTVTQPASRSQLCPQSTYLNQQKELRGPPGFPPLPVLRKEQKTELAGPPGFPPMPLLHQQLPKSSTVCEKFQQVQQKLGVSVPLNNLSNSHTFLAVPQSLEEIGTQNNGIQERHDDQQEEYTAESQMRQSNHLREVKTTAHDTDKIFSDVEAVAAAETSVRMATNLPVYRDDDGDDDAKINRNERETKQKFKDGDIVFMSPVVDSATLLLPPDVMHEPEPEPQTPPVTTLHMRIDMRRQAEEQSKDNITPPPLSPCRTPPMQIIPRNPFSSSLRRAAFSPRAVQHEEDGVVEPTLSPGTTAHVAKVERKLQQGTENSFESNIEWTAPSLSTILTLELKDIVLNGPERFSGHCRQSQTLVNADADRGNNFAAANAQDTQEQQEEERFNCFNSNSKQLFRLEQLIRRLVTYANCSPSVFVVMLIYVDRVQQQCKYLRLTYGNVNRVVVAAFLAAVKFVEDRICSHADYADLSGIDVQELNGLEFLFNQAVQWTFFVTADEYEACEHDILKRWTTTNAEGELDIILSPHIG